MIKGPLSWKSVHTSPGFVLTQRSMKVFTSNFETIGSQRSLGFELGVKFHEQGLRIQADTDFEGGQAGELQWMLFREGRGGQTDYFFLGMSAFSLNKEPATYLTYGLNAGVGVRYGAFR